MTSFRQIEANRRNALLSTGPTSQAGKRRSRHNAIRHGLSAETVVDTLEDVDDYRGFEAAVIASYDARNAVERELVLRLASLMWRLRRATMIETELLKIQAANSCEAKTQTGASNWTCDGLSLAPADDPTSANDTNHSCEVNCNKRHKLPVDWRRDATTPSQELAHCLLQLFNVDRGAFERLGRYESALARQLARTLLILRSARAQ